MGGFRRLSEEGAIEVGLKKCGSDFIGRDWNTVVEIEKQRKFQCRGEQFSCEEVSVHRRSSGKEVCERVGWGQMVRS